MSKLIQPRTMLIALAACVALAVFAAIFRLTLGDTSKLKKVKSRETSAQARTGHADALTGALPDKLDRDAFDRDLAALTANPHRLAGYENGSLAASQYVLSSLRQAGFDEDEIVVQPFPVVQPVVTECLLTVDGTQAPVGADGRTIGFYPCRPNVLQASITPSEGLSGRTLYVGKGTVAEYGQTLPEGMIVVMDFDCERNWLTAFALGAKAVIFVGSPTPAENAFHHVNMPANFPRFYATPGLAQSLGLTSSQRHVVIKAAASWQSLESRNVLALVRGTNPDFPKAANAQTMVLAAPLDSYSEVPELSPGARDAANCAVLLQMAKIFRANRPRRDVIFAFFDAQAQHHLGARAFYGALFRQHRKSELAKTTIQQRLDRYLEEQGFIQAVEAVLDQPDIFSSQARSMPRYSDTADMMRIQARMAGTDVLDKLRLLRLQRDAHTRRGESIPQELLDQIDTLSRQDKGWNEMQRVLHRRRLEDGAPQWKQDLLAELVSQTKGLCRRRLAELDLAIAQTAQGKKLVDLFGPENATIMLHLSVNLSDSRNRWTFIHGDDSDPLGADKHGLYRMPVFQPLQRIFERLGPEAANFDPQAIRERYDIRMFAPGLFVDSGAAARLFSLYNVSAMTIHDPLPRQGQPCDTVEALQTAVLLDQADSLARFVREMGSDESLSLAEQGAPKTTYDEDSWSGNKASGPSVMRIGAGSAMADLPVRDAVVAVVRGDWDIADVTKLPPGFVPALVVSTDSNGIFEPPPYPTDPYKGVLMFAAGFDKPSEGMSRGLIERVSSQKTIKGKHPLTTMQVTLFNARLKSLVGYGFDRLGIKSLPMKDTSESRLREDRHLLCEWENVLTLFVSEDTNGYKVFNKTGPVLLNADDEKYTGKGLSLDDPFEHPVTVFHTSGDLTALNGHRLDTLRSNRIIQNSLDEMIGRAKDVRAAAKARGVSAGLDALLGDEAAAASLNRRVYVPLTGVMNDLVTAVVLLLLLAIPFGYALERLLVGTPHIYRQIGWFAVFFLATFAVLYFVNPAFRIAATPIIIFLAFSIILLSCLVIFIMTRKLQTEVKRMQGLASTVHSTDVSRLSTMMAAVNMGISTMRRRPLRTFLTAATVLLLTFTILTFASFGSSWSTRRTYQGPTASSVPHIVVRHQLWNAIGEGIHDMLRGHLAGQATVVPRYWVSPTAKDAGEAQKAGAPTDFIIASRDGERLTAVSAAVGIDKADFERQGELRETLSPKVNGAEVNRLDLLDSDGVLMTEALRDDLALTDADIGKAKVLLRGRVLTFAGTVSKSLRYTMLEGSSILPVDYQATGQVVEQRSAEQSLSEAQDVESAQFMRYQVDKVVFISPQTAQAMKGKIRAISIYPEDLGRVQELAEQVALVSELPTYAAGTDGAAYRLIFTSLATASGVKDLLIPVLLGGLIIFATMLGSVSDREREIYTFSSLGLAPPHVASLFFAEASMYAVIGGMGGYLLGQVVARGMVLLSGLGISVPPMNYSSTNAIVTVLIVMCTVLVSTAFPALKASRSANPGIQRAWRIPKPKGNVYDLVFPFTVSAYDITGVVSFLKEHFDNYSDTSLGVFATTESNVFRQRDTDMLGIRATVALAPFDLGVNQSFALLSQPSDIEGIDEVRIIICRLSGAHGDWQRANRVFVNELRKQLLIWRSLAPDVTEHYRQKTLQTWDLLPRQQVEPQTMGGLA